MPGQRYFPEQHKFQIGSREKQTNLSFHLMQNAQSPNMNQYLGDLSYGELEALINARALANRNTNPLSTFANLPPPAGSMPNAGNMATPQGGGGGGGGDNSLQGIPPSSRSAMANALLQQEQQALQNRQNHLLGLLRLEQQRTMGMPGLNQGGMPDMGDPSAHSAAALAAGGFKMNPGQFNPLMGAGPMGFGGIPPMLQKEMALPSSPKQPGRKASFPRKLYKMLMDLEASNSDVAMFVENGHAFAILNPQKFTEEVLPKYFSMKHYASFQRQLNLYKFKRVLEEGPYHGCYYHKMFTKGNPALIPLIKREAKPKSKKAVKSPAAPSAEADASPAEAEAKPLKEEEEASNANEGNEEV